MRQNAIIRRVFIQEIDGSGTLAPASCDHVEILTMILHAPGAPVNSDEISLSVCPLVHILRKILRRQSVYVASQQTMVKAIE